MCACVCVGGGVLCAPRTLLSRQLPLIYTFIHFGCSKFELFSLLIFILNLSIESGLGNFRLSTLVSFSLSFLPPPPPLSLSLSLSLSFLFLVFLQVLESRALYNLGNVYHARGKHATTHGFPSNHDRFSLEDYVRTSLEEATHHYEYVQD